MATRRLKLTGFARFFIVMLFLVPVAYLGAAYYNGQDGIQNIKNLLGIDQNKPTTEQVETNTAQNVPTNPATVEDRTSSLESRRISQLEKRMNELESENVQLRNEINQQREEMKELRRRIAR